MTPSHPPPPPNPPAQAEVDSVVILHQEKGDEDRVAFNKGDTPKDVAFKFAILHDLPGDVVPSVKQHSKNTPVPFLPMSSF